MTLCYWPRIADMKNKDSALFNDTVFQNVANGLPLAVRSSLSQNEVAGRVYKACAEAEVAGFVQSLPDGYQTRLGERSSFLSGGQRQRIAIARAIVRDPQILLLDEATSALDPTAEKLVQRALERVAKQRTTVVIAHNLSTVQQADQIIFLKDGLVLEHGDHVSLVGLNGHYARSLNRQAFGLPAQSAQGVTSVVWRPNSSLEVKEATPRSYNDSDDIPGQSAPIALDLEAEGPRIALLSCLITIFGEQRTVRSLSVFACLACVIAAAVYPGQAIVFAKSVSSLRQTGQELVHDSTFWALIWFVLATGAGVAFWTSKTTFAVTGSRLMTFYRHDYFLSMMAQDMNFFATASNSAATLTAKLMSHPELLAALLSNQTGSILLVLVNIFSSCALSVAIVWKLGLVAIFAIFPLISLAGYLQVRLSTSSQSRNARYFEEFLRFASECVTCIQTISALTMEDEVREMMAVKLRDPTSRAFRETAISMSLFALSHSAILLGQESEIPIARTSSDHRGRIRALLLVWR